MKQEMEPEVELQWEMELKFIFETMPNDLTFVIGILVEEPEARTIISNGTSKVIGALKKIKIYL